MSSDDFGRQGKRPAQDIRLPVPPGTRQAVETAIRRGRITIPAKVTQSSNGQYNKVPAYTWKDRTVAVPFKERPRTYLWAYRTGAEFGLVVPDFDGDEGAVLLERSGLKPHRRTGSGGHHVEVAHPGWKVKTVAGVLPGLDVRGDGGIAYFAGQSHKGVYQSVGDHPPYPVDQVPEWLRRPCGLWEPPPPPRPRAEPGTWEGGEASSEDALRLFGWWIDQIRDAPAGESNAVFHKAVFAVAGMVAAGAVDPVVAEAELLAAGEYREVEDIGAVFRSSWAEGFERPYAPDEDEFMFIDEEDDTMGDGAGTTAGEGAGGDEPAAPWWQDRTGFPKPLDEMACYGLAGEVVDLVAPRIEASPAAVLVQFLTAFGAAVGRGPFFPVAATRHHAHLFAGIVAPTGSGKGDSLSGALAPLRRADPDWARKRLCYGLSTGEGIVHHLRDRDEKDGGGDEMRLVLPDKRLLDVETEFTAMLVRARKPDAVLSQILRQAWDDQTLENKSKTSPEIASDVHLALIVHTTPADLVQHLDNTAVLNGFAGRFVWVASRQERTICDPGPLPERDLERLAERCRSALSAASRTGEMSRDRSAAEVWERAHPALAAPRPGAFGAVTARARAQVLRLSMIYALTDGSPVITRPHLEAALALWAYAADTAAWVFGRSTGDAWADRVLEYLREAWPGEVPQNEIRLRVLNRNTGADAPLALLEELGLATGRTERTGERGRPRRWWKAASSPPPIFGEGI